MKEKERIYKKLRWGTNEGEKLCTMEFETSSGVYDYVQDRSVDVERGRRERERERGRRSLFEVDSLPAFPVADTSSCSTSFRPLESVETVVRLFCPDSSRWEGSASTVSWARRSFVREGSERRSLLLRDGIRAESEGDGETVTETKERKGEESIVVLIVDARFWFLLLEDCIWFWR